MPTPRRLRVVVGREHRPAEQFAGDSEVGTLPADASRLASGYDERDRNLNLGSATPRPSRTYRESGLGQSICRVSVVNMPQTGLNAVFGLASGLSGRESSHVGF